MHGERGGGELSGVTCRPSAGGRAQPGLPSRPSSQLLSVLLSGHHQGIEDLDVSERIFEHKPEPDELTQAFQQAQVGCAVQGSSAV